MKKYLRFKSSCAVTVLSLLVASTLRAQPSAPERFYIQSLFAEAGKPSVYELAFTTQEPLHAEAEFTFEFPAEFDLTLLQVVGSPDINGGFTLKRDKQKVWVKRSGLGQGVAAGTLVRIRLGAIVNPQKLESSAAVAVQVRRDAWSAWTSPARPKVTFVTREKSE